MRQQQRKAQYLSHLKDLCIEASQNEDKRRCIFKAKALLKAQETVPCLIDSKTSKINKGRLGHDTLIEIKAGGIQMLPNRGLHWQCIRSLFKKKKRRADCSSLIWCQGPQRIQVPACSAPFLIQVGLRDVVRINQLMFVNCFEDEKWYLSSKHYYSSFELCCRTPQAALCPPLGHGMIFFQWLNNWKIEMAL